MSHQNTSIPDYQRNILDNLNTAVLMLKPDLSIAFINPASENLFQFSSKQATGAALNKLMYVDTNFEERLNNALKDNHPISEHEASIRLASGREIIIDYVLTPLVTQNQTTQLMLEITHMDRQIRIAREEQLLNEQSATRNLVRGMAHEIKNPLGGLRGAAQLLERELPSENLKEYTQIIIGEADRLQSLVDRMLGPNNIPKKNVMLIFIRF